MRMANSLLYASRISHVLWASAVAHANYLKNRLPHPEALGRYTSYELFFKKRPRISDLRVWGCDAYELLPAGQVPGQANRRRVIYVGHSPDRLGWRVFDPITFKFSISFELLFDEESAKKRICALREFDARRTLARQGRLDEFPLLGDDFNLDDLETAAALDSERRLYPIPLPPPDRIGSGGVKGDQEHARAATAQDGAARGAELDGDTSHEVSATSRTPPSDFMGRSSSVKGHSMGEMYAGYTIDGEQVPRPSVRLRNAPNVPGRGSSAGVASASQRDRGTGSAGAPEGGSAGVAEVGSAGAAEVGSAGVAAVDAEIDDQEAQLYGPLSEQVMAKYRSEPRFDPRCPIRPLRVLPTGRVVEDNEESKSFRKWAYDMDIPIRLVDNPKVSGTESYKRYNRYQDAKTLRAIVELSTTARSAAKRREQQAKARQDIVNDYLRGYIIFVNHENPSPTHFVSAAEVAKANGTLNVHALYSCSELEDARESYLEKQEARHIALFSQFEAKGFLTFQEQMAYLWDEEPKSRLYDGKGDDGERGTLSKKSAMRCMASS